MTTIIPTQMSSVELHNATAAAAHDERRAIAELLTLLAEVDSRRLYLGEGCPSLFAYCTQVLHLSEHAAYHRIEAARAARQHPLILERVANGDLTLTTVALLRPHLTAENHETLLEAARHKSKREVEYQIACLAPKEAVRALIRRIPDVQTSSHAATSGDVGAAAGAEPAALKPFGGIVECSHDRRPAARPCAPASPRLAVAPLGGTM